MGPSAPPTEQMLWLTIDHFWEAFPPMWNRVRGHIRAVATEHFDITVEQFHILRHIRRGAGSISQLAEARQISRPAISQTVEMLVNKGLVDRRRDPDDRRYVRLALTEEGSAMLNAIFEENRAWMVERLAVLSPQELDAIVHAMDTLKRTFDDPLA